MAQWRLATILMLVWLLTSVAGRGMAQEVEASATPRNWAVVIVGLPGDDEHRADFERTSTVWTKWLRQSLAVAPEQLWVLSGPPRDDSPPRQRPATRQALAETFATLAEQVRETDSLWILVLGHGHYDGRRAWLHVSGPDPEAADLARMLSGVRARQQVVWLTQAASGWWVQPLARPGRMVIAATATEQEENETEFPHALATVMQADPTTIDLNSDGHVSLAELFRATVRETNARFDRDQRLATEHAQLDDNADGKGTEVDRLQDEDDAAGKPDNVAKPDNAADGRAAAKLHVLNLPAKSPP